MRKLLRQTITLIRASGGSSIWTTEAGRHTRVHFVLPTGEQTVMLHRGGIVSNRNMPRLRSQLRRKIGQ